VRPYRAAVNAVRRLRRLPILAVLSTGLVLALLTTGCSGSPASPAAGSGSPASIVPSHATSPGSTAAGTSTSGSSTPAIPTSGATSTASSGSATVVPALGGPQRPSTFTAAPGTDRTIALTFDDGASSSTLAIARVLMSKGATATFFDVGREDAPLASVVQQVSAWGFPVEDHSWDHRYPAMVPGGWTVPYLRQQITRTADLQQQLTGHRSCFFRPPGGFTTNVRQAAYGLGVSVVLWSVDTLDWRQPAFTTAAATSAIVARATAVGGQQHPIVLLHAGKASSEPDSVVSPNRSNTVAALPAIIDWYAAHGYRFVAF
jgi:peptidoglycan/xylan/chitin deacetylase (PgdA/CDA1 family)